MTRDDRDRPVIGIVGGDVPRQLVTAAGADAFRLTGSWDGAVDERAAQLLGSVDVVVVRILSELLRGDHSQVAAIVVCNDSAAHLRLFYVLRMLEITPVHLLDLPRKDSVHARRFVRHQFGALWDFLTSRAPASPLARQEGSARAGEIAVAAARERLRARRRADPPRCTGSAALDALIRSAQLPPVAAVDVLDRAGAEDAVAHVGDAPRRVHVTGSSHPDSSVYRRLEADGRMIIVSEDHDTGDGAWCPVVPVPQDLPSLIDSLTELHFARTFGSATEASSVRADLTASIARASAADLVVALIREADDAPEWDLADQRRALGAAATPLIARSRVHDVSDILSLRQELVAWLP